jgi:hypothetical protein
MDEGEWDRSRWVEFRDGGVKRTFEPPGALRVRKPHRFNYCNTYFARVVGQNYRSEAPL